jgi:hypothetical protein
MADRTGAGVRPGDQRPAMRGSITEDPTGGSVIRTYYLADVWLRVSVVLFVVALWIAVGTRFGTTELVYIALVVLILFGANERR